MRGNESKQASMLCLLSPESRVPAKHPIRKFKAIADAALKRLELTFSEMYSDVGRPSVPPETLLKSALLIALYSVRRERLFCEQLQYNLLFRWFLDMDMDQDGFDHSSFSQNRSRLMQHDVARKFLAAVVAEAQAAGTAERDAAARMLRSQPGNKRITVGADRGYDTRGFVDECRSVNVTPHVAQNTSSRRSAIDERTTGHEGYRISQRIRMRIEEVFGWMKTVANFRKTKLRGLERNRTQLYLVAAAYNLLRMSKLLSETA